MKVGVDAGVEFEEVCGGNAECRTCLVNLPVDEIKASEEGKSGEKYQEPEDLELDSLDQVPAVKDTHRLACQTKISEGFQGIDIDFYNE